MIPFTKLRHDKTPPYSLFYVFQAFGVLIFDQQIKIYLFGGNKLHYIK